MERDLSGNYKLSTGATIQVLNPKQDGEQIKYTVKTPWGKEWSQSHDHLEKLLTGGRMTKI